MAHLVIQRMGKKQSMRRSAGGLTSCCRFAALSSTVNWQLSVVSGFLDFTRIRVRSSVLCEGRPQVCSGSSAISWRIE